MIDYPDNIIIQPLVAEAIKRSQPIVALRVGGDNPWIAASREFGACA